MERRGRIPVAKFRTQEGKTRSRSRVREPDYNEQDPETDLFTLIEDNLALKEENKSLKQQINEQSEKQNNLQEENEKLITEIETLKSSQDELKISMSVVEEKFDEISLEKIAFDKLHKKNLDKINSLTSQLKNLQKTEKEFNQTSIYIESNAILNEKISKIIPAIDNNELESLVDIQNINRNSIITSESIEKLVDEFKQMKSALNTIELQLYEANEKISDLMENQHQLEIENDALRMENSNLTRVAQLLTENMKESVKTSKKMEDALVKLKNRNDILVKKNQDMLDSPTPPSPSALAAEEELQQVQNELKHQNREHGERIVEMQTLVAEAIEKSTNDDIKLLKVKLEIMQDELNNAIARAIKAEKELELFKNQSRKISTDSSSPSINEKDELQFTTSPPPTSIPRPPPPPPPPPMPSFLFPNANYSNKVTGTLHDNIKAQNLKSSNTDGHNNQSNQQVESTGLDAIVREIKEGKVTLRRSRRKTQNNALQEMFQVLETSRKQNRNSTIAMNQL